MSPLTWLYVVRIQQVFDVGEDERLIIAALGLPPLADDDDLDLRLVDAAA
jgi:hypothetical protein